MKRVSHLCLISICAIICLISAIHLVRTKPVHAQQNSGDYYDGTFYISSSVDVDSNYTLYLDSYMEVEFDEYEDIDNIEVDAYADEDGQVYYSDYGEGYDVAEVSLQSTAPVDTGHEYGLESDGWACFDDGEGDCDWEPVGGAYASVYVGVAAPHIDHISPSSDNQGSTGTLTISGSNLVEDVGDQLTLNYSGEGMPFTPTGTPSSSTATFSYDLSGYDVGTYTISVTNNEGTSNSVNFTVNPPLIACTQSRVPNSFTVQITDLVNQNGSFTVSHPTVAKTNASTTVSYGPFSTPTSVASALAATISHDYLYLGIAAKADGPNITIQSFNTFGNVAATSSGPTFSVGTPSTVSCIVPPHIPCIGINIDYDTPRLYKGEGITETPRQHITRRHILGTPSLSPLLTVYANTLNASSDQMFGIVEKYNLTSYLLEPYINGSYTHTFPKRTIQGVEFGLIGYGAGNKELFTNKFFLDRNTCKANSSFPVEP